MTSAEFRCCRIRHRLFLLLMLLCVAACSGRDYAEVPIHPATGKLTVEGEPAHGAYITFHPVGDVGMAKGNKPFARVSEDGTFAVTTYDTGDGAPAGEFKVTVYWPADPDARGPSPDRLKGRYRDPESTALVATFVEGENAPLEWDLDK